MGEKLKVAVIGTGWWGGEHARIFARRPDTELVAAVGRTPAKTEAFAQSWGTRGYTDLDQMFEAESPDLVTLALPNEAHYDITMRVIEWGVPLLLEKPLVFRLDEARAIVEAAESRDLFVAFNLNHRYAEPVLRAKQAVDAGTLGDLVFATWRFGGEPNIGTEPWGNLIETQVHGIDMLEHLAGPIASVMAQATDRTNPGFFTTMAVAIEFASGAVGSLVGSYDSSYAYPDTQHIEINGTRGRVLVQDTVKRFTLQMAGDESREVWEPGYFNDEARTFVYTFDRHVDAIMAALRDGQAPPIGVRAGQRALQVAHAMIESFETGCRVGVEGPR